MYELLYLTNDFLGKSYLILRNEEDWWCAYCDLYSGKNFIMWTNKYIGYRRIRRAICGYAWGRIYTGRRVDILNYNLRRSISDLKLEKTILAGYQLAEIGLYPSEKEEFVTWKILE